MIQNRRGGVIPTLEEYLEFNREIRGFSMILDLSELLEITQVPELQGEEDTQNLLKLKQTAFDVIAWSMV
jgi:Terpene synthase family 2, C-terminal metal binding